MRVAEAFARLILEIQPSKRAQAAARERASAVRAAVARHLRRPVSRVVNLGSYQKGSGIRGHSDVDLLFVLAPQHLLWGDELITSTSLLERFRRAISTTYPTTSVGHDGQSIAVRFSRADVTLDVVPAVSAGKVRNANLYLIPDGTGEWMKVAPLVELRRFRSADAASGGKLRRTVQLLKWWKHARIDTVKIRSYYMELLLTAKGLANGPKSYSQILFDSFSVLAARGARGLRDPDGRVGITSAVSPRASEGKVEEALDRALEYADDALWYEARGDTKRALARWRVLFNHRFPG